MWLFGQWFLLNLISHPLLGYLLALNGYFGFVDHRTAVVILEMLVVFGEWGGLIYVLRESPMKLFMLSLSMNLASFLIGLLLFPI